MSDYFIALLLDAVVSVSVSVSAETENFFRFRYRFRQKRTLAILACFGFGRNKKEPFGRALLFLLVLLYLPHTSLAVQIFVGNFIC